MQTKWLGEGTALMEHCITGMQTDGFFTGHEPTLSKEPEVDIGDSGDILLPKPVTPQPGISKNDRRKEGKSKREQEEEEREKMQYVIGRGGICNLYQHRVFCFTEQVLN